MSKGLTDRLKDMAKSLGFSMVGITEARPGRRLDAYQRWLANEYHGRMGYMARPDRIARRQDLNVILPGAKAIVSVGLDYSALQPPEEMVTDLRGHWGDTRAGPCRVGRPGIYR
jgi:epoxyqueuosine reductase